MQFTAAKTLESSINAPAKTPAPAIMFELAMGYWLSRCLYAVAEIGVADHIADAPVSAADLTRSCGVDENALRRVMKALSSRGIFEATEAGFAHSSLSLLLRSDHPQSIRAFARMIGMPAMWNSFGHIEHVVRTGERGSLKIDPEGIFHFFQHNPAQGALFNDAMEAKSRAAIHAVLGAYDFSYSSSVADVGGGKGHLVKAILEVTPDVRGFLFDQAHVVSSVPASDRLQVVGGDFFTGGIPHSDLYLLMEVIHDWDDEQARTILKNIRAAARPGARLLIIETLMPESSEAHVANALDIVMLVITGGRERTRNEHAALVESAGFPFKNVLPTQSSYSILEAVAV
ncbi:methyltransferase [Occallatibacter savannae]|uniref:methyltransferase n=1 Tax=Occallatibacter savannae TaxID=1002691 RepID=UPI000D687161|nr:methyltransferase [Occallatibacter savannae]